MEVAAGLRHVGELGSLALEVGERFDDFGVDAGRSGDRFDSAVQDREDGVPGGFKRLACAGVGIEVVEDKYADVRSGGDPEGSQDRR